MKRNIAPICLLLQIVTLYGCSVSPTRMTQTYDSVEIQLSSPDKGRYSLVSTQGRPYGFASGATGKLTFRVPAEAPIQGCYTVLNGKGKNLLSGPPWFYLSMRPAYLSLVESRNGAQRKIAQNEEARRDAQSRLGEARAALANNQDWKGSSCEAPPQGTIPPRPETRCNSREECAAQASQGCFSEFFTKEICGVLLSKYHAPISIPVCRTIVEGFDRKEYGSDGQFAHSIGVALALAIGKEMLSGSDNNTQHEGVSLLEMADVVLEIANAVNEYGEVKTCTDSAVESEYGPLEHWMHEYGDRQAESDRLYQSCTDDQRAIQEQSSRLSQATAYAPRLVNDVTQLDLQLEQLEAQREPLTFCTVRSVPVRLVPQRTYIR